MSRVDYQAAWDDLLALIVSRDGWGAKSLVAEAVRIAERHRVDETFLERALRMYGGEVHLVAPPREAVSSVAGSTLTGPRDAPPPTDDPKEDHDGNGRTAHGPALGRAAA